MYYITLMCVLFQRGRSFINSVLSVEGVSKSDAFFKESITVTCSKGIITPSIFEDDKWCACKYGPYLYSSRRQL